jgi:hypothetical protein
MRARIVDRRVFFLFGPGMLTVLLAGGSIEKGQLALAHT